MQKHLDAVQEHDEKYSYLRRMSSEVLHSSGSCEAFNRSLQISNTKAIEREQQRLFSGVSNTVRADSSYCQTQSCYVTPSQSQDCGATSWAVSRRLSPTLEVRFDRKPVRMGFVVDPVTMGQVFHRELQPFSLSVSYC